MRNLILTVGFLSIFVSNSSALHFCAYGDSRSNPSIHQTIVTKMGTEKPVMVLHVGDLWSDYNSSTWKGHYTANTTMAALLNGNKVLVSLGNHESSNELLGFSPSLVRNNSTTYAFKEGNCYFVCMGYDPGANNTWLETQLKSTESSGADWRFIWCHKPIYSIGQHGANGTTSEGSSVSNFRMLCDKYKVTAVFTGHDHSYQRSYYIYNGAVVTKSNTVTMSADTHATFYIVCGGAGAPLYSTGSATWSASNISTYHYCGIDATSDKLTLVTKKSDGSVIDQFTINKIIATPVVAAKDALLGSSIRLISSHLYYQVRGMKGMPLIRVRIALYSLQGKRIAQLLDKDVPAGKYTLDLKGLSEKGTGTYLCTVDIGGIRQAIVISLKNRLSAK